MIELVEYELRLATGEVLRVAELDPERLEPGAARDYVGSSPEPLTRCTRAPRRVLEQAKRGYDAPFRRLIGTPPHALLMRLEPSVCASAKSCLSYGPACMASYSRRGVPDFPLCWSYAGSTVAEREVVDAVAREWRDGRLVVIAT